MNSNCEQKPDTPAVPGKRVRVPRFCFVSLIISGACLVLYLLFRFFASFADWYQFSVAAFLRAVFATLTCWFPFSLAEILFFLVIPGTVALSIYGARKHCDTWREAGIFLLTVLCAVLLLLDWFVLSFAAGYFSVPLEEKLNLTNVQDVTTQDLYHTADILVNQLTELSGQISYGEDDFSVMPYDIGELNEKLMDAYQAAAENYDWLGTFYSRVKPVMISRLMSYTHITGIYTYFTGESNLNVDFPDYSLPFTAAHELSHQRGISPEDEANFVAFLVTKDSDDVYVRYSGYLNLFEYVYSALYDADIDLAHEIRDKLPQAVFDELVAYDRFFDQYRDSAVSVISGSVNDTFLKSQGTEGEIAYELVVNLAVAYYR